MSKYFCMLLVAVALTTTAIVGFASGVLLGRTYNNLHAGDELGPLGIDLPTVQREFVYGSPFSQEPPIDEGSGISEPIWDTLIPNGLGYFEDEELASQISIPTVFHQLHCLYLIRRAYYSRSRNELENFDFGKDRSPHVAHCFEYLMQGLTCSADTSIEPALKGDKFLGRGVLRQCRDFERLKGFVEARRAFNATGFLAHGLHQRHFTRHP
ncbi:hypothetical protein F4811DRAFT_573642 [Daldinia bambusicola]|nr:hypothetical protein F4811DRAFT_573642 [Daldinia bambusicola]